MTTNLTSPTVTSRRGFLGVAAAAAAASTIGAPTESHAQTGTSKGGAWKHDQCALLLVDYQPEMFRAVRSETSAALIELNVRFLVRAAKAFDIPIVLSTVGVKAGVNTPTLRAIAEELPGVSEIDRISMDAWEDSAYHSAVERTGRKRLVFGALWTEICLVYQVVDALRDGYEAMFVIDAIGGVSQVAHETGIRRLIQAGAIPNTARATITEWFRDWSTPLAQEYHAISAWYGSELLKVAGASGSLGG
jgi:nicotinamidase-related amidase